MKKPEEIKKDIIDCMEEAIEVGQTCDAKDLLGFLGKAYVCMTTTRAYIQQLEAANAEKDKRIAELEQELEAVKQERDALCRDLSTRADACMICDCGWLSPSAEGNSPSEALGAAYQLALPRCGSGLNAPVCGKPKRVTHEATKKADCTCPSCKNVVSEWMMFRQEVFCIQTEFCKFCGQALDWSGEARYNDPQKCACYSTNGSGDPICMGTKELDPCKGPTCERWRKRAE